MNEGALRRNVGWLIAIRVAISTILLGSATFMRATEPGSFAVDPFFFLIGLTYALTIGYALALRFVERLPLAGRSAARARRAARLRVHLLHRRGHQLLHVAVRPAGDRGQHDPAATGRPPGGDAQHGALQRPRAGPVPGGVGPAHRSVADRVCAVAPVRIGCALYGRDERVRVVRRRSARRDAGQQPAVSRRPAEAGFDRDRRSPGAEPARDRQPAERSGHHRSVAADPDVQPRRRSDYRNLVGRAPPVARSPTSCSCPSR